MSQLAQPRYRERQFVGRTWITTSGRSSSRSPGSRIAPSRRSFGARSPSTCATTTSSGTLVASLRPGRRVFGPCASTLLGRCRSLPDGDQGGVSVPVLAMEAISAAQSMGTSA